MMLKRGWRHLCPVCGSQTAAQEKYCPRCGCDLERAATAAAVCVRISNSTCTSYAMVCTPLSHRQEAAEKTK